MSVLGFSSALGGPTWQRLLAAYIYPFFGPPRFDMSQLVLPTILPTLAAVCLECSLKVSFPSNHNSKYFRVVQSLFCSPPYAKGGRLNQRQRVNNIASIFMVAGLSLADSIQRVITSRVVFTFHSSVGILSSAVITRVSSV